MERPPSCREAGTDLDSQIRHSLALGDAGRLLVVSLAMMILARRFGRQAQSSAGDLGEIDLRLVPAAEPSDKEQRVRPAA
jgi:hypothetical protein